MAINTSYLVMQLAVLGLACASPLVVMWLAFMFVRQRSAQVRGELLSTRPITAEGVMIDAAWLQGHTAVEIYRRADGLHLRPVTPSNE